MGLQADGSCGHARLLASVRPFLAAVFVIAGLKPIHPDTDVASLRHDGLGEKLIVIADHPPRGLIEVQPAGAEIDRRGPVPIFIFIADLRFVACPELSLVASQEYSAVGMVRWPLRVAADIELEDEILPQSADVLRAILETARY